MAEHPARATPKLARTDFESMTHEQLAALIDAASSEGASHLAGKLSKAASTITKIGDDLMTHVKGLDWQGEGGDAFRDWGGQTAGSTLRLGQYAEVASRWMATVAQAVAEAKAAMPKVSETTQAKTDLADAKSTIAAAKQPGATNDPDARKLAQTARTDATAAQGRIEAARSEAIQQMQKLAQAYEYSAQQVNSVQPPTFSPPAEHMDRKQWDRSEHVALGSTGAGGTTTAGAASHTVSGSGSNASGTAHQGTHTPIASAAPVSGTEHVDRSRPVSIRPVSMGIDGTATLPESSTPAPPPSAGPATSLPRSEASPLPLQGPVPPSFGGSGQGPTGPAARVPSVIRPPMLPGQGNTVGSMARMPRETGIVGGRPVQPGAGRQGGIPRGTVIGGPGNSQGRTPMMRGLTPGTAGSGSGGTGQGGVNGGRRLASETGGVVGSRSPRPARGARPFTPGGSGLVRPTGPADPARGGAAGRTGAAASQSRGSTRRRDDRQGDRPDYLAEDEETWAGNNRRALPPVVD
ncbi:hypothetical protein QA943_31005 [Streptomyces sp. B21-097]|uniref:hypothetical protein n=1 Tax=Streptomyces sp. B21-097 TaxID=3039414 RepID=UPI002FF3B01D